jgi:hypothetical protein
LEILCRTAHFRRLPSPPNSFCNFPVYSAVSAANGTLVLATAQTNSDEGRKGAKIIGGRKRAERNAPKGIFL